MYPAVDAVTLSASNVHITLALYTLLFMDDQDCKLYAHCTTLTPNNWKA